MGHRKRLQHALGVGAEQVMLSASCFLFPLGSPLLGKETGERSGSGQEWL